MLLYRPLLEGAPLDSVLAVKVEKPNRLGPCCRRGLGQIGPGEDGTVLAHSDWLRVTKLILIGEASHCILI